MTIKTPKSLIGEALKEIKTISSTEALQLCKENKCNLIDLREKSEIQTYGEVENSIHMPRGLLEFHINNERPDLDFNKELVLFCAAGARSALAAKTLKEMGFEKVSHIDGGFSSMKDKGFKII